jgi:Holliday junction resolvasome RuvABC endonuclease subunit
VKAEKTKKRKEKNKDINIQVKKELIPFTNVLGLDQSTTGTGYAIVKATGEVIKIEEINSEEDDFIKRTMETIAIIKKEIEENNVKIIALENIYLEVPRFRNAIMNKVKSYEQLSYLKNIVLHKSMVYILYFLQYIHKEQTIQCLQIHYEL